MSVSNVSHSTSSSVATSTEVLPCFIVTKGTTELERTNRYRFLSPDKIRLILNSFTNSSNVNVRTIWETCKEKLESQGYTITFIEGETEPYAFKSEDTIRAIYIEGNKRIYIGMPSTTSEENITRWVFNGQTLTTNSDIAPSNITNETYKLAHELAHVVSFLSSPIAQNPSRVVSDGMNAWDARKRDWSTFLKESRMEPIRNTLQTGG
ncbi:MAG: hypothetical protein LBE99_00095, partial [Puniceicoccales bacterium]|nr:hypothetical protein [Puniceicoccales bacterium]